MLLISLLIEQTDGWKQKWIMTVFRESMAECFGKAGIPWHGVMIMMTGDLRMCAIRFDGEIDHNNSGPGVPGGHRPHVLCSRARQLLPTRPGSPRPAGHHAVDLGGTLTDASGLLDALHATLRAPPRPGFTVLPTAFAAPFWAANASLRGAAQPAHTITPVGVDSWCAAPIGHVDRDAPSA